MAESGPREVGVQVPCGDCTEISQESHLWQTAAADWGNVSPVVPAKGDRTAGRTCPGGSCAHVAQRAAAVQHCDDGGVSQGQECDSDSSGIRESPWDAVGT